MRIKSLELRIKNRERGFTLAEVLAVMVAFTVVGSIVTGILITSFRTSNKSAFLTTVNQNGDYALTQMSKIVRDARFLNAPYPCNTPDNPTTTSSAVLTTVDGDQITLSCNGNSNIPANTIASNGASLLDTNAVSLKSCQFTCSQTVPTDFPVITISFSLAQAGTSQLADQTASSSPIPFSTTVTLRNLDR